jgi:3-phenylpropionate/trans-cinnamate dioxygenase ferredoxin subunit
VIAAIDRVTFSAARTLYLYREESSMERQATTIGKASAIKPGELAAFEVAGRRIAVANANGQYYAVDEICTHEQCSLVEEGTLDGTVVTCGCHGAEFDITNGQVLAPPAFEPLKVYPIQVAGDELIVEV